MPEIKNYTALQKVDIQKENTLSEAWVQELIKQDPQILGLGKLICLNKEKKQANGRLDLLLSDEEDNTRWAVEVQLGTVDPDHIVRCIEYWDVERKRNPSKKHKAVIVAENITSRFLNVISLFNGSIPLIALQMTCFKAPDNNYGLIFTKILDEVKFEDQDIPAQEETNREYWEAKSNKPTLKIVDGLLSILNSLLPPDDTHYQLNYNKHYIGITLNGVANNFLSFHSRKKWVLFRVVLPQTTEIETKIDSSNIELLDYKDSVYRLRVTEANLKDEKDREVLKELIQQSLSERG